jgi:serine/threonine protein phosphatase PrpC
VEAILQAAEVREMKVGPVSLTLNALRPTKKKSSTKKRKEPVEAILMEDSVDKKKRKAAAAEAMKRLSQFLIVPQGVELLLENIPNIEVKNLLWKSPAMMRLNGPVEPNPTSAIGGVTGGSLQVLPAVGHSDDNEDARAMQAHNELAAGLSVSTYPFLAESPNLPKVQAGSPNCDFFTCSIFQGGIVACITDGCGWGTRSQNASRTANQTFVDFVESHLGAVLDFQQASLLLMRAIQEAHDKIVEGARRAWEVGTTTLCGGVLFQVAEDQIQEFGAPYAFMCVNIGDCKAYYCTQRTAGGETKRQGFGKSSLTGSSGSIPIPTAPTGASSSNAGGSTTTTAATTPPMMIHRDHSDLITSSHGSSRDHLLPQRLRWNVSDITTGNRISDAKITGGHLGPKSGPNEALLQPDLGNFTLHITPCNKGDMFVLMSDGVHDNLDPESLNVDPQAVGLDYPAWLDVPIDERTRAKDIYRADLVAQHVDNTRSPSEIAVNMLKWVRKVTENKRQFMENNSGKEEPAELPGKMDHTTIVVFGVE